MYSRRSRTVLFSSAECSADEGISTLAARIANDEDYVVAGFDLRDCGAIASVIGYGQAIDLNDQYTLRETDFVCK